MSNKNKNMSLNKIMGKPNQGGKRANGNSSRGPPTALSTVMRPSAPRFGNSTNGITLKRREFVGSATNAGTGTFMITPLSLATPGYDFNPSCTSLFPWLARVSPCYERFKFKSLKFEFVPSQPTTTFGRYYAAVDYDYDDTPATTKQQLMGNMTAVEAPIWDRCELVCNPASLNRDIQYRYVSSTARNIFVEARTTFAGFLMIAFDTPAANCIVDIWTEYEVELVTPVLDDVVTQFVNIGTSPACADLTTAIGGAFIGPIPVTSPVSNGTVINVTPGVNNVPTLRVPSGAAFLNISNALDISKTSFQGAVDLIVSLAVGGVTPSALLADDVKSKWAAFSDAGSYLGVLTSAANTITTFGCEPAPAITLAGGVVRLVTSVVMERLRETFPTARYLGPYVQTDNAQGAGYASFGWRYSD